MDDAPGMHYACHLCGATFFSQWAADACREECELADREARRR